MGFMRIKNGLDRAAQNRKIPHAKATKLSVLSSMSTQSLPEPVNTSGNAKTWLQLYVDAMTEKDPYKRLALVEELRKLPRHDESEEMVQEPVVRPIQRPRVVRRRRH
ncbi:MAG: hypothetical protein DMG92_15235 [Acidobacteria bacterium]|jgi:hypothetical protein|nr:MAG: hypothetical protein DMG92_15235 [Acidobacteriota bacterium]